MVLATPENPDVSISTTANFKRLVLTNVLANNVIYLRWFMETKFHGFLHRLYTKLC